MDKKTRTPISYQDPKDRISNFDEVCLGYTREEAILEASRCLKCKNPKCVDSCPVGIDIPGFIQAIEDEDFEKSAKILLEYSSLPAVCGRVCPQEDQCEMTCVLGIKHEPIAIGKLERFAGDYGIANNIKPEKYEDDQDTKVAVVGSGPAGISCASELARMGYRVSLFEALHKPGGVLSYGIPSFRLPKSIVHQEIQNLLDLGVDIQTNVLIGRTKTLADLKDEGYEAIFIGSGAGTPYFLNIKGENLNGIYSANEFLTRTTLMEAYKKDMDTPIISGQNVLVIGGGNVAMDAARTARRLGSNVTVVYRRTKDELPARIEEVENAIEEGIDFLYLSSPVEFLGETGKVSGIKIQPMALGDEDSSGRRSVVPSGEAPYEIKCDMAIIALGTSPNVIIPSSDKNLATDVDMKITVDDGLATSIDGVFAGGDVTTGSATVIEAMGAGKTAARMMDLYIKDKTSL